MTMIKKSIIILWWIPTVLSWLIFAVMFRCLFRIGIGMGCGDKLFWFLNGVGAMTMEASDERP